MAKINIIFIVAGVLAIVYGALILWSAVTSKQDMKQEDWLRSEEVTGSKFNKMEHLRYLLQPEHKSISFSRSKSRGYAMVAIGIVLIVFGIT
ncbi:MAG: hypothetical protein WBR15_06440 [Gammaproteobacteria bacterium]